ncbi:AAA family ATPase [Candidatus Phytoplasma pini]|uniref:Proteasome-activating nucleotidase n=1 Tax=Candidatus Phytoplasma pini TaxID=267362 RepID=A0A559KJZ0_9MOLU|nr:AAA family ATPase [Candidatus Phytoplasma pini]TVY12408.1 Proteasome-activating nucleotidase [Candidatus Phytoplasma pini]
MFILLFVLNFSKIIKASIVQNINLLQNSQSPSVVKLKKSFPQLKNNEKLLMKVLKVIVEEFKNEFLKIETKSSDDLINCILFLDQHDMFNNLKDSFSTVVYKPQEYVFVFPGNTIDFANYQKYLWHKSKNFIGIQGNYWKNSWSPANISFVSKKYINFLIDCFEEIENLQKQIQTNENQKNLNESNKKQILDELKQRIQNLEKLIKNYNNIIQEKESIIQQFQNDLEKLGNESKSLKRVVLDLEQNLTNIKKDLNDKQRELNENKNLSEKTKQILNKEIESLNINIVSLNQELTTARQNIEEEQKKSNNLEIRLTEQKNQINNLRRVSIEDKQALTTLLKNKEDALKDVRVELDESKNKILNLSSENNFLTTGVYPIMMSAFDKILTQNTERLGDILVKNDNNYNQLIKYLEEQKSKNEDEEKLKKTTIMDENKKNINAKFLKKTDDFSSFKDVIGMESEVKQLKQILKRLKQPELYKQIGVKKSPKGILLYGPPGTGKTFLAQVFAKESELPFFSVTSSDFSQKYVGEGSRIIESLFEEARKHSPCVVLIDECENIFKQRISDHVSSDHGNNVTSFLSQIDGIYTDPKKPVFIIATTNYKNMIDPAIISRFDTHIKIDILKKEEINIFLKMFASKYRLDIRSFQYLDQIAEQINDSPKEFFKTPRKIVLLLEKAAEIAIERHNQEQQEQSFQHLNILPIDLKFAFEIINENIYFDWGNHEHKKHELDELFSTKQYKKISIKHLFKDSQLNDKEKKYFEFIFRPNILSNQFFFNDVNQERKQISFSLDKDKIKAFYNSENPFPERLLGFYFEYPSSNMNTNDEKSYSSLNIENIKTLEEVLQIALDKKIKLIYFIWDINKIEYNKTISEKFKNEIIFKYPFLQFDKNFNSKISDFYYKIDNNKLDIEKNILNYIDQIKKNLCENIFLAIISSNYIVDDGHSNMIKQNISSEVDFSFLDSENKIYSIENLKDKICNKMKPKSLQYPNMLLKQKIQNLIDEKIFFNKKVFSEIEIKKIKNRIKDKVYTRLKENIEFSKVPPSYSIIETEIEQQKEKEIEDIFNLEFFLPIYTKLEISLPFLEKEKFKNTVKEKLKQELFYGEINLNNIKEQIQKYINDYIEKFEIKFKEEIFDIVHKYFFIDNFLDQKIDTQEIEFIKKSALFIAKKELEKDNATNEKINEKILSFVKRYKAENIDNQNKFISYILDNFYFFVLFVLFVFFSIKFSRSSKNK